MGISLQKGGNVNLSKAAPSMTKLMIGLGWDVRVTSGPAFDLDGSAFLLSGNKVRSDSDFVFYHNLKSPDGSVVHSGDNRTGAGEGDDEAIFIDLLAVPADVDRIAFAVTLYEGEANKQNFGMINKAYIRCVDAGDQMELARYDLSEDSSSETSMIFGEVYRYEGDWKFRAVGQGFDGGLAHLARAFGVDVS
ncbi:TerD family protein [Acinetobacter sp.]|uniref:TerD family protein n=1 Tax=Acinetobacter sp. TaxID=472 RepID=UPI003890E52F